MAVTTMPMTKTEKDCNRTGRRKNFRIIPLNDDYIGNEQYHGFKRLHDSSRDRIERNKSDK